jgi:hypothetical protein
MILLPVFVGAAEDDVVVDVTRVELLRDVIPVVVDDVVVAVFETGGFVPNEGCGRQVVTSSPAVSDARPSGSSGSAGPGGTVPTYALKLYRPHGHTFDMSISDLPCRTTCEPRVN